MEKLLRAPSPPHCLAVLAGPPAQARRSCRRDGSIHTARGRRGLKTCGTGERVNGCWIPIGPCYLEMRFPAGHMLSIAVREWVVKRRTFQPSGPTVPGPGDRGAELAVTGICDKKDQYNIQPRRRVRTAALRLQEFATRRTRIKAVSGQATLAAHEETGETINSVSGCYDQNRDWTML